MPPKRRTDPGARPGELIAAARKVLTQKGVANCTVSDIVDAAGAAKGTFYLYFASKDDIINAVVEQIAQEMVDAAEEAVAETDSGAVDRFVALRDAIATFAADATSWELAENYHRPENRAVHDRMAEQLVARLAPIVESIVEQGVEEGVFVVEDAHLASWFVLGGLRALELAFPDRSRLASAIVDTTELALRALGYAGAMPNAPRPA